MRIIRSLASLVMLAFTAPALAASPPLVPPGWRLVHEPSTTARTFVSPNGSSRLRFGHEAVQSDNVQADAQRFMQKQDETVTYQRQGDSWFVVSGYRSGEIFYRKGNLACRGSRWNLIEFRYPREAKRAMDAAVTNVAHKMGLYRNDCG